MTYLTLLSLSTLCHPSYYRHLPGSTSTGLFRPITVTLSVHNIALFSRAGCPSFSLGLKSFQMQSLPSTTKMESKLSFSSFGQGQA